MDEWKTLLGLKPEQFDTYAVQMDEVQRLFLLNNKN